MYVDKFIVFFFFSSRRRHTRWNCDWSSDVWSSDLTVGERDARRVPLGLERAGRHAGQLPGVWRLEPVRLEQVFAPEHGEQDVVLRDAVDLSLHLDGRL